MMIPALYVAVVGTRENKYIRKMCKQLGELETDTGVHRAHAKPAEGNEKPKMDVPHDSRRGLDNARDKRKDPAQSLAFK